jgi:hypothetical protein
MSSFGNQKEDIGHITPNQFDGTDTERIQSAVDSAKGTTNKIVIPSRNSNGTNKWMLDSAILLPDNMTVILENCTIQLSDQCRDNMFRSNNVGIGIQDPKWNHNIGIVGIGDVVLKGADNPRATGDGGRRLVRSPEEADDWRVSYGSDAGKEGVKQTGDWRNIMILMAYVDGFKLQNVKIENSHAWAVSHERVKNADISDIRFNNPRGIEVDGKYVHTSNKDGINLRHGCKNFCINNISGKTGDDFIALTILGLYSEIREGGNLESTMVTTKKWRGPEDAIEQISITNINCHSPTRGVAIRAIDSARIQNVSINGLIWKGDHNAILMGGSNYGKPSLPGKINNIRAMNIMGNGNSLIHITERVADCYFMNGMYYGEGEDIITYEIDKDKTQHIISKNMMNL